MWQWCFCLMAMLVVGQEVSAQTVFRQVFGESTCYNEGYTVVPFNSGFLVSTTYQCGPNRLPRLLLLNEDGDSTDAINAPYYNGYIHPTTDGNWLFLGGNRAGLVYDSILIAKVNTLLDTTWTRTLYLPECNNQVYDLVEVADGYVVTGIFSITNCSQGPSYQSFATKLNFNGEIIWAKTYGNTGDDELFSVRQHANGQLWFYGWQRDANGEYPWLLITDANGDSITSYTQTTLGNGFGYGFDLTADGGFITLNYSDSIYARKFDSNLTLQWQRNLGLQSGGVYFRAFEMLDLNYGFLACVDGPTGCNSHLYKIDRAGNTIWDKNWNGLLRTVQEPQPGQFLLTGYTNAFPVLPEALVVRFDTIFDSIPIAVPANANVYNTIVYPNPAHQYVTIQSQAYINQVTLWALDGRLLFSQYPLPSQQLRLALPQLPQALYLLVMQTIDGKWLFKKLEITP